MVSLEPKKLEISLETRKALKVGVSNINVMHGVQASEIQKDSEFEFWARQLVSFMDPASVVFASFVNGKFNRIQLIEVVKTLKQMDYFEDVESINVLPHPNFVKVKFVSPGMVEIFKDTVEQIDELPIKFVDPENLLSTCFITVTNIPAKLIPALIGSQLEKWGSILKIFPQFIPKKNGLKVQIGQTRFEYKFGNGYSVSDLPYFLKVAGFKVYLYIRGRKKICFRCGSAAHLVSSCPLKFCGLCRSLKEIRHDCMLSYATVTNPSPVASQLSAMHDKLLDQLDHVDSDQHVSLLENGVQPAADIVVDSSGPSVNIKVGDVLPEVVIPSRPSTVVKDNSGKRVRTRSVSRHENQRSSGEMLSDHAKDANNGIKAVSPKKIKKRAKAEESKISKQKAKLKDNGDRVSAESKMECCGKEEPSLSPSLNSTSVLGSRDNLQSSRDASLAASKEVVQQSVG